jgi:tubulin-specific chaperone A
MPPTQIQIATSSLERLVKEEASYYKEIDQQQARITKIENGQGDDPDNLDFQLKQEVSVHLFDRR